MATTKPIGKITHYYGKIGVAIVALSASLKVGDNVEITGKTTDFSQRVDSMQIDHREVQEAGKGDIIGMKANEKVREGDKLFPSEE